MNSSILHIGFDAKRLFFNSSGLGNYSRTLIENLIFQSDRELQQFKISLFTQKQPGLKFANNYPQIGNALLDNRVSIYTQQSFNPIWRTWGMGKAVHKLGMDVFHGLSNEIPQDLPKGIMSVVTIHDVLFKQFPKQYSWLDRRIYDYKTAYALKHAHKIIATSHATANSIRSYYSIPLSNIHVIYQSIQSEFFETGIENDLTEQSAITSDYISQILTSAPYIIYHSTFNYRKNHLRLLKAFNLIKDQIDFNLVLPGFMGHSWKSVNAYIKENQLENRVVALGAVTTNLLITLMQRAKGFIYPSLNEGFGIPLAEAAAMKLPFMVSDIPVFKELIGQESDFLFKAEDINSIAKALLFLNEIKKTTDVDANWAQLHQSIINKTHPKQVAGQLMEIYQS